MSAAERVVRLEHRSVCVSMLGMRKEFGHDDTGGCMDAPVQLPRGGALGEVACGLVFDSGNCGHRENFGRWAGVKQ